MEAEKKLLRQLPGKPELERFGTWSTAECRQAKGQNWQTPSFATTSSSGRNRGQLSTTDSRA